MFLGKSVLKGLKYRSEVLFEELPERFGNNFEKNKSSLNTLSLGLSKDSRNVVAGYVTRLAKRKE
jgi:ribosomal protein S17E